jgi:hypothetical protein
MYDALSWHPASCNSDGIPGGPGNVLGAPVLVTQFCGWPCSSQVPSASSRMCLLHSAWSTPKSTLESTKT